MNVQKFRDPNHCAKKGALDGLWNSILLDKPCVCHRTHSNSRSDCVVLVGGGRRAVRFMHSRTKVFANMCMYRII